MASLPTGTVTFLFTDIQGSTQLWQQYPAEMPAALVRHHLLLRQAIEGHGGYVFQIIGDAFCAAFHTASDGLLAAIEAQRLLRDEAWGETGPILVRMALHSGAVDIQAGDYTSGEYRSGITLSRAARLLSAGHGGQVLLSLPTFELLGDQTPIGIELRDLGARRLKDLRLPEQIYQIVAPDLPFEFPPLKTLDSRQNNLPAQLTSFIGREREIAEIRAMIAPQTPHPPELSSGVLSPKGRGKDDSPLSLPGRWAGGEGESLLSIEGRGAGGEGGTRVGGEGVRLVTLSGPGGSGKTRLALQVAADLIDEYPDGVWFVDLSPLVDGELVAPSVAGIWGLREQPWRKMNEVLADYVRTRKMLLVLDNCEHLLEACARLAHELLQAGAQIKMLATSRELLNIPGEVIYRVPVLSLPDAEQPFKSEQLFQYEAVRLFVERAVAVRQDFGLTQANAPAVASICQRLDGIPLAIELAAARMRALSAEQVADRLDDRFRLLTGGSRTSLPRQQTLRALIDWSYNLLADEERWLFERLAVFLGGWTLEAAQAVCAGDGIDDWDIIDLLERLVDRSLVVADQALSNPRYRMLETIRQYSLQALQVSEKNFYWQGRHLDYFLRLAEEAAPSLRSDLDILWLERLESEHDNLRLAFDTAIKGGNPRSALRISAALDYFWYRRGHIQEALQRVKQAVEMPGVEGYPRELANALQGLGLLFWLTGAYHAGLDALNRCLSLVETLGDAGRYIEGLASHYRAITQMRLGNFSSAREDAERSRMVFTEIQDAYGLGASYYSLGRIAIEQGKFQAAQEDMDQALQWSRKAGDRLLISLVLNSLELLAVSRGDFSSAQAFNQESLDLALQINDIWMVSGALREAGNLALALGDYPEAVSYFRQSGEISSQQGLTNDLARVYFNLGYLAVLQGDLDAGQSYFDQSRTLFGQLGNRRGLTECLDGYAALAANRGKSDIAARLLGAADASFREIGAGRWPVDQLEYQKLKTKLEAELGEELFTTHYKDGMALKLEQALKEEINL